MESVSPGAFGRRLLEEWRRLGLPVGRGARAVAAVSGGADSAALLFALDELIKARRLDLCLRVAHLDHGLRGEAGRGDARFVEGLASRLGYEFETRYADVAARARETTDNLEQAARRERYEFLGDAARKFVAGDAARRFGAAVVVTAHTLDDQAETVLLALLRGGGTDGLGGMSPTRRLDGAQPPVLLARPLLAWARRADTEGYCRARGVEWRVDATNDDERLARVRVRRKLLPLLETFNPRAAHALARTAELLREDAAALDSEAARLLDEAADATDTQPNAGRAQRAEGGETQLVAGDDAQRVEGDDAQRAEDGDVHGVEDGDAHRADGDDAYRIEGGDAHRIEGDDARPVAAPLNVDVLAGAPSAWRRRAIRLWLARGRGDLRRLSSAHVAAVEKLLGGERGGRVAELPGGASVERRKRRLYFRPAATKEGAADTKSQSGREIVEPKTDAT